MMKFHILFLGLYGNCRSQIAEAFAKTLVDDTIQVVSAGIRESKGYDPNVKAVMDEIGIDLSHADCRTLSEIDLKFIDLVVIIEKEAWSICPFLPGSPALVRWDIASQYDSDAQTDLASYRQLREDIHQHVEQLFKGGYLQSIMMLKRSNELILDHFEDGIIVHDAKRRISWFNTAAEKITGYPREEVIGNDCHDIFDGGFCSGRCSFCEDEPPKIDKIKYPVTLNLKDGTQKRIDMSVAAINDEKGQFQGVLACFRDMTEIVSLRSKMKTEHNFHGIIGGDDQMQTIYSHIRDLSHSDCSVLILGESGTGKELVASAIHNESGRAGRPFVTVNCGALPEGILESELFGHVKGAFTGAVRDKKGRFELADQGTLFLDEVAELTPNMQVKLLRVLQEGVFERVGGEEQIRVDVRVISATNRDLRKMVQQEQFREDLFYRLCVVPVNLPPLRDRRNDIPMLVNHFIQRFSTDTKRAIDAMSTEAMGRMLDYNWPGNIRELQNAIQYAFVKCKNGIIELEHLPPEVVQFEMAPPVNRRKRRSKLNREQVIEVLKQTKGNKKKSAEILGVGRATLHRFVKDHGLS